MTNASNIREHMEVIGSCGRHVGTVDHVDGEAIKLTKNDPNAGGKHHYIPLDWVANVDQKVQLSKSCEEASRDWDKPLRM